MTYQWAFSVYALALSTLGAACASSPPELPERGDEVPLDASSDPVVIGSKQDASRTPSDTGTPEVPGPDEKPVRDAGKAPSSADGGDGASVTPPRDASAARDGAVLETPDAGFVDPEAGNTKDAGPSVTPPLDAGPVVVPVDAGVPDAGPAQVADAGRVGCLPGVYKGAFQGEISALLGVVRIDVAGDITINVELGTSNADHLMIKSGILQGTDTSEDKNPLFARIGGVLNCATKQLEKGTITDGTYNRVDPLTPWITTPTTTTFSGTITGLYATNPPAAVGTWMVKSASGTRTSMGTWNAALQ